MLLTGGLLLRWLTDVFDGYVLESGTIVDASFVFVEVPKQRNTAEKNAEIKSEKVPEAWKKEPRENSQIDSNTS